MATAKKNKSDSGLVAVDAVTGSVYTGEALPDLVDHYNSDDKRHIASPRATHIGDRAPVLAKPVNVADFDLAGNIVGYHTQWSIVTAEEIGSDPVPGNYKLIHLLDGSTV